MQPILDCNQCKIISEYRTALLEAQKTISIQRALIEKMKADIELRKQVDYKLN